MIGKVAESWWRPWQFHH